MFTADPFKGGAFLVHGSSTLIWEAFAGDNKRSDFVVEERRPTEDRDRLMLAEDNKKYQTLNLDGRVQGIPRVHLFGEVDILRD